VGSSLARPRSSILLITAAARRRVVWCHMYKIQSASFKVLACLDRPSCFGFSPTTTFVGLCPLLCERAWLVFLFLQLDAFICNITQVITWIESPKRHCWESAILGKHLFSARTLQCTGNAQLQLYIRLLQFRVH